MWYNKCGHKVPKAVDTLDFCALNFFCLTYNSSQWHAGSSLGLSCQMNTGSSGKQREQEHVTFAVRLF